MCDRRADDDRDDWEVYGLEKVRSLPFAIDGVPSIDVRMQSDARFVGLDFS